MGYLKPMHEKMKSCLTTKWVQLLKHMYLKGYVSYRTQSIYKSMLFYKVINELIRLKWVQPSYSYSGNGKGFKLSLEGIVIVELVFSDF